MLCNDQNGPKVSGIVALVKFGYMLENPWMLRYSLCDNDWVRESNSAASYSSDNSSAAENQQERLSIQEKKCWSLAGLIEGEGSLCVSIKNHKPSRFGYLVDPEFFIYQHKRHRDPHGLVEIVRMAYQMNMEGKQRKRSIDEMIGRILRDYTPNTDPLIGEDIVRAAWRHAG